MRTSLAVPIAVVLGGMGLVASTAAATPGPAVAGGFTGLVSVNSLGVQGNGDSVQPAVSKDGSFVAFASDASNLVAGDSNSARDIFLRNRQNGVTTRVSLTTTGGQANGRSYHPTISGDGRYVVFASEASNLVPGDTNHATDIFVRDRRLAVTKRVSVSTTGGQANGRSDYPDVTPDGRYVAYMSAATNLATGDTNLGSDIFVRDRLSATTSRIRHPENYYFQIANSSYSAISDSGRWVAFWVCCELFGGARQHLREPAPDEGVVFLHDAQTGRTTRITARQSTGTDVDRLAIDASGRYITYAVSSPYAGGRGVRSFDQTTGQIARVSDEGMAVATSADGRFVAFAVPSSDGVTSDAYLWDRTTATTSLVSVHLDGAAPDGASSGPAVNSDGSRIAFESTATNIVPKDTNGRSDIFIRGTR